MIHKKDTQIMDKYMTKKQKAAIFLYLDNLNTIISKHSVCPSEGMSTTFILYSLLIRPCTVTVSVYSTCVHTTPTDSTTQG